MRILKAFLRFIYRELKYFSNIFFYDIFDDYRMRDNNQLENLNIENEYTTETSKVPINIMKYGLNIFVVFITIQIELLAILPIRFIIKNLYLFFTGLYKDKRNKHKVDTDYAKMIVDITILSSLIITTIAIRSVDYSMYYHILRATGLRSIALIYIGNWLETYVISLHTSICINKWLDLSNILTFNLVPANVMVLILFDIIIGFVYLYQLICFHSLINITYNEFWSVCVLSRINFFNFYPVTKKADKIPIFDEEKLDRSLREFYKQFYFAFCVFLFDIYNYSSWQELFYSEELQKTLLLIFIDYVILVAQTIYDYIQTELSVKSFDEINLQLYNFFCLSYTIKNENSVYTWWAPRNKEEMKFLNKDNPNSYFQFALTRKFMFVPLTCLMFTPYGIGINLFRSIWESFENRNLIIIFIKLLLCIFFLKLVSMFMIFRMIKKSPFYKITSEHNDRLVQNQKYTNNEKVVPEKIPPKETSIDFEVDSSESIAPYRMRQGEKVDLELLNIEITRIKKENNKAIQNNISQRFKFDDFKSFLSDEFMSETFNNEQNDENANFVSEFMINYSELEILKKKSSVDTLCIETPKLGSNSSLYNK